MVEYYLVVYNKEVAYVFPVGYCGDFYWDDYEEIKRGVEDISRILSNDNVLDLKVSEWTGRAIGNALRILEIVDNAFVDAECNLMLYGLVSFSRYILDGDVQWYICEESAINRKVELLESDGIRVVWVDGGGYEGY